MYGDLVQITPEMAELGATAATIVLVSFDEDTEHMELEVCILTDRKLPNRQAQHLMEASKESGRIASHVIGLVIQAATRCSEISVNVRCGIYTEGED